MRNTTRALAATACAAIIGLGTVLPADAATISSVGPATLMAKGVTVSVPVTGTCDVGEYYSVGVTLTQKTSGKTVVQGSAGIDWNLCVQEHFSVTLFVQQRIYDYNYNSTTTMTFKKGSATAAVNLGSHDADYSYYTNTSTTTEIRIG